MNKTYDEQRTAAEKIADLAVKEAVLRGLDRLRETYGENWVERIDPEKLDMSMSARCVLGQLESDHSEVMMFSPFLSGADRLGINEAHIFGFDAGPLFDYSELDEAWLTVIGEERP